MTMGHMYESLDLTAAAEEVGNHYYDFAQL